MVIKCIKPEFQNKFKEKMKHQKQIVARLKDENSCYLPKYYSTQGISELKNCILMEYIIGQQLDFFIKSTEPTLSFRTKIFLLLNVIFSLRHFDIKPIIIMVCRQLITKIIDYGEAYHRQLCPKNYNPGFTLPYVAPQVLIKYENKVIHNKNQEMMFSEKQDVFAFGMIIYEVIFNCKPFNFNMKKCKEIYLNRHIQDRVFTIPEKNGQCQNYHILSLIIHTIEKCLNVDPQNRPKIDWIGIIFKIILNFLKSR